MTDVFVIRNQLGHYWGKGKAWVDRRADLRVVDVPRWFMDWVPLETPEGTATMMAGWRQAGALSLPLPNSLK